MRKVLVVLVIALTSALTQAVTNPLKPDENSFVHIAKNCVNVDLATWKHPVRVALVKHEFEIQKMQLCNDGKYPVFYGQPKADPRSSMTYSYFVPLYESLMKANGRWPFSMVFQRDHYAVSVSPKKGNPDGVTFVEEHYDDSDFVDPK